MFFRSLVLFVVSLLPASGASFSDLYFFGDSLTDTGNIYAATTALNALTFGLVPVQPASPPYSNGRFSDGPIWAEQTAARLGQPGDAARASMSLGPLGVLPGAGNNYAIGGARTGFSGGLGILDPFIPTGTFAQVTFYLSQKGQADPNALYFLSGGGNDLRDASRLTDSAARAAAAVAAADYSALALYTLYPSGARNFMLINGPNVGLIPESIAANKIFEGFEASLYFNFRLAFWAQILGQLPGLHMGLFDLSSFYNEVFWDTIGGGQKFGFTSAITPCKPGTPGAAPCATSLFFDEIHPTSRLHTLVGDRIADQIIQEWQLSSQSPLLSTLETGAIEAVPEPATFALVFVALSACAIKRRRQA